MKLKNPIREIRKAMTPPRTQCVHSRFKAFNSVTILCDSGAYLDHVERTCCERYDNFVAIDVRGTRWCRFEQKPPKAEDGDESRRLSRRRKVSSRGASSARLKASLITAKSATC